MKTSKILSTLVLSSVAISATNIQTANAQTNVQIYGIVDYGYSYRFDRKKINTPIFRQYDSSSDTNSRFDSGVYTPNRIGFKGSEDLGNGLKLVFTLERGFDLDTGSDKGGFNRQAYIGLTSDKFGTLIGGRIYTPYYKLVYNLDPFKAGTAGAYNNINRDIGNATGTMLEQIGALSGYNLGDLSYYMSEITDLLRVNNALSYTSPNWGGFSFNAAFSNNALADDSAISNAQNSTFYSVGLNLERPNYLVGLNYHHIAMSTYQRYFGIKKIDDVVLGGSYQFENFHNLKLSAFAHYNNIKFTEGTAVLNKNSIAQTNYLLGAEIPFGKHIVKGTFNYSHNSNKQFGKAYQIAVGYDYYFSKRTNFYAAYSFINNDNSSIKNNEFVRYGRFVATGDASNLGASYQQAIQFGITHRF